MKILNINICNLPTGCKLSTLPKSDSCSIFKVNTEFLVRALGDEKFAKTLNNSTINLVDGRGVQWAARYLTVPISDDQFGRIVQAIWQMIYSGAALVFNPEFIKYPITEIMPGIEAFRFFLNYAVENRLPIFIFGGGQEVLQKAIANIEKDYPDLKVAGYRNGYDYQTDADIDPVKEINKTEAKMLFVAQGSPKQEYWIEENLPKLKQVKIAIGEGGTLDRIAYPAAAAPKWVNRLGLEWFWRLFANPSKSDTGNRLVRVWNAVPVFIYEVVKWKIKYGQTKVTD